MNSSELYNLLLSYGWYPAGRKGAHVKMMHEEKTETLVLRSDDNHEIGKGLQKKILSIADIT